MTAAMTTVYDFSAPDLYGREIPIRQFKDQVLLIVNTASHCGFTPQYAGLNDLHKELGPRGFSVLAFPCNQFGEQDPAESREAARGLKRGPAIVAHLIRLCRLLLADLRFGAGEEAADVLVVADPDQDRETDRKVNLGRYLRHRPQEIRIDRRGGDREQ